jgi:hypothetical protein
MQGGKVMNIAGEPRMGLSRVLLSLALGGVVAGLGIVGGRLLGEQSALAADPITVNSTADDTLTNLAENTTCDLREAIAAANTDAQVGQCNVGGGDAATINITSTGTVLLTANLPAVTDTLIINGPGADSLTIDGASSYRHFEIASGTRAEISGLTLARGYGYYGGAVYSAGGLTITNSRIHSNHASWEGGGIYASFASCSPPTTTLRIINSTVYSNTAVYKGGGIYVDADVCYHPVPATLMLTDSTVNDNSATRGGGIYLYYTSARLFNSTVSGNHASEHGGGIGTLADWDQPVDLVNCTIYTNTASNKGGGMQLEDTFTVSTKNTIVAGNDAGGVGPDIWGTIQSYDYNLIQNTSGATIQGTTPHNITGINPILGLLADNGGRTWTHALLAGSPAINAGSCTDIAGDPITVDQRGVPRISPCDIGAYEYVLWVYLPIVIREATSTPEPQIHVYGRVSMEDGTGMADVGIYVGVVCIPGLAGSLVATTDQEGYYEGETDCPFGHDETMRVFAVLEGYTFVPELDCWRTYGYCPGKQTDFVAFPFPTPAAEY